MSFEYSPCFPDRLPAGMHACMPFSLVGHDTTLALLLKQGGVCFVVDLGRILFSCTFSHLPGLVSQVGEVMADVRNALEVLLPGMELHQGHRYQ